MKSPSLCRARGLLGALLWTCVFASAGFAASRPNLSRGDGMVHGGNPAFAKAARDTHYLIGPWGSGADVNGQFQTPDGVPIWNGWTHRDLTQRTTTHWQVSDYQAGNLPGGPGNLAAWCGEIDLPACDAEDEAGGYGNSYHDLIEWRGTVADPDQGVTVRFTAVANIDSEPGYDGTTIRYLDADGEMDAFYIDGYHPGQDLDVSFALDPQDYLGDDQNEVVIRIYFTSDGGWSDADCMWPTTGGIQIDDIMVTLDQAGGQDTSFTDFESGWGDWEITYPVGVGDFAQIWTGLLDLDPCVDNSSPQVAFIDDGEVVEGVGPSLCIDWCYGPGGYIVNCTGGAAGEGYGFYHHLYNQIESPVIPWPEPQFEGASWVADIYKHEGLYGDSPSIYYLWGVRSTADADPESIESALWRDRNFFYFGGPEYIRTDFEISDLLVPGCRYVQLSLAVWDYPYYWWEGRDGTPAPYFDNVRMVCYPYEGPSLSAREIDLANDNFPASGQVDLADLGTNSVRFDMAATSSLPEHLANIPGDSIVVDVVALGEGAELVGPPELHWRLKKNPIFDPYRTSEFGTAWEGVSPGYPAANAGGTVEGRWAFDLPDSNFLFPGDVLHYFIEATDSDGLQVQTAYLPADTTGFSDFRLPVFYDSRFSVRALPSVRENPFIPGNLIVPEILYWDDSGDPEVVEKWIWSLGFIGLAPGRDYDHYSTNWPDAGVGNGLGGRATPASLGGYDDILYSCGDKSIYTLGNGDFDHDPSADLQVLDAWLRLGSKNIFLTGDKLVYDLTRNAGPLGDQFVDDWLKVEFVDADLRPLINNQTAPLVEALPGNGIFWDFGKWVAFGGCPGINRFDAVLADSENGGIRFAEFCAPNGESEAYGYSAATLFYESDSRSKVISFPYEFGFINGPSREMNSPDYDMNRIDVLEKVLASFGIDGGNVVLPAPQAAPFHVQAYPNPFNPVTRIRYHLPQAGQFSLKIFDLRGGLVTTLVSEVLPAGAGVAVWDGTDQRGQSVSSGVYFYRSVYQGEATTSKLVLLK